MAPLPSNYRPMGTRASPSVSGISGSGHCHKSKSPMKRKKILRLLLWTFIALFVLVNAVAFMQAYKFTHFSNRAVAKTKDAKQLSFGEKMSALFFGIDNPRPENQALPAQKFDTIHLSSNKMIECWSIIRDSSRVIAKEEDPTGKPGPADTEEKHRRDKKKGGKHGAGRHGKDVAGEGHRKDKTTGRHT